MIRPLLSIGIFLLVVFMGAISLAEQRAEHVEWNDWILNWEVKGNTGLSLTDVSFKDKKILASASMPVIRVKYVKESRLWNPLTWFGSRAESGRCGPFQDRITWNHLQEIGNCNKEKVCVRTYQQNGIKWLELGVYARIGEYHIYQGWHLSEEGEIRPIVHSRGLSCHTNHIHHPYWRFDFDIDGPGRDQVFVHDSGAPDTEEWGAGWHKYTSERNDHKLPGTDRKWFVRDQETGNGVWILPGKGYAPIKDDGVRDAFSNLDVAIRRGKFSEDEPWKFGARGELRYDEDQENVQEQDIVFWYVAHLEHFAAQGPVAWLAAGPTLHIQP